jgi:hypothetical protein
MRYDQMKRVLIPALFGSLVLAAAYGMRNIGYVEQTVQITRDSERVCRGTADNRQCGYEVYTDQGVFANKDSIMHLKFDSSDLNADLVADATCEITAVGFRIPFLSMHKNILTAECQKSS